MKRLHISLLIVFISSFFINISAATLHFEKFQSLETLPTNEIQQLYTDREGYVWLATSSGLFRFDGYKSVIYKSNFHTPDLLVNNTINCVVEDYDNNLWIGTMKGVNRLNKKTGAITNVPEALNDIRVSGIKIGRASCRERVSSPV